MDFWLVPILISLNDRNTLLAAYYQWQKDSSGSVEFTDVQIVYKFKGRVTSNLDFNVKYLEMVQDRAVLKRFIQLVQSIM